MGSQWANMGYELLKIEQFAKTFDRCASVLKPLGVNLYGLISSNDETLLKDVANCFVSINAIQIALTDVLFSVGLRPDYFFGHSLGEQGMHYFLIRE